MKQCFLFLLLLFVSCKTPSLSVRSEYWSRSDLASSVVDTPDPRKTGDLFGQHLLVSWAVSRKNFRQDSFTLRLQLKLKNGEYIDKNVPLTEASGTYSLPIIGDDFMKKGGLLSYFVQLEEDGKPIQTCRHKFWVEQIQFSDE